MTKYDLMKKIIFYEALGFLVIFIMIWLDEILDIPHQLFGAPVTPINYYESIFESVMLAVFGSFIIKISYNLLIKIKYLEGFLATCAFCKRIRINDAWVPFEKYIQEHSGAEFAHILCPECIAKHYGPIHTTSEKKNPPKSK